MMQTSPTSFLRHFYFGSQQLPYELRIKALIWQIGQVGF